MSSEASQTWGWAFQLPKGEANELIYLKPGGPLNCSDGQVLHDRCLAGYGIAAPPNGIYAVFPHARHLPLRVRLWIDFLKLHYGQAGFWRAPTA